MVGYEAGREKPRRTQHKKGLGLFKSLNISTIRVEVMGKSRRSRGNAAHRKDPIAKAVKPPSDPELAALREAKILPVLKDLQGAEPKSRSAAATAISSIIQDTRCRKLLLREQIVHIVLTQTLTDAALESRAAGWGILSVLAQEEEADFCVHLYRLDILTAIEHASKVVSNSQPIKYSTNNGRYRTSSNPRTLNFTKSRRRSRASYQV